MGGGANGGQDIFQGGKTLKKSSVSTTLGGQDPQKVIGFDHFIQENANFFMISQKVGTFFRDFTDSWGGGKTTFFWGKCPPLPPPGAATEAYVIIILTHIAQH